MQNEASSRPCKEADPPNQQKTRAKIKLQPGAESPGADPTTVLIVEDSAIVRERLADLIEPVSDTRIVGEAADGLQARELFQQHRPDAVVLDLQLPGISGLELLEQFKREHPDCVVMVLTTYAVKEFRERCTSLGADHFFDKSREFERVIEVLEAMNSNGHQEGRE